MRRLLILVWVLFSLGYVLTLVGLVHQGKQDVTREIGGSIHFVEQAITVAEHDPRRLETLLNGNTRHFRFYLDTLPDTSAVSLIDEAPPDFFSQWLRPTEPFLQRPWQYPLKDGHLLYVVAAPEDEIGEVWESALMITGLFICGALLTTLMVYWGIRQGLRHISGYLRELESQGSEHFETNIKHYSLPESARLIKHFVKVNRALAAAEDGKRALTAKLMSVQEQERLRLGHAIHDDLGQYVTGIQAHAYAIQQCANDPNKVARSAKAVIDNCDHMQTSFRTVVQDLHPLALGRLGLQSALDSLIDQWQNNTGLNVTKQLNVAALALSEEAETHLYRFLQEALTNVAKHAKASEVLVRIQAIAHQGWQVEISDNGQGLEPNAEPRVGMLSMRERARQLGAKLMLESTANQGTRIVLTQKEGERI